MNVADDDLKSTPIGLASAGFGVDDDLISSRVATDWFAPVLMRNRVDLACVAADPILDSALLNHDSHRVDVTRASVTIDTTRFTGAQAPMNLATCRRSCRVPTDIATTATSFLSLLALPRADPGRSPGNAVSE